MSWFDALNEDEGPASELSESDVLICRTADGTEDLLGRGAYGKVLLQQASTCQGMNYELTATVRVQTIVI